MHIIYGLDKDDLSYILVVAERAVRMKRPVNNSMDPSLATISEEQF